MNTPTDPNPTGPTPGVPPTVADAAAIDWSGSSAEAAVGQLFETMGTMDRLAARAIENLIKVVDSNATETAVGVAPELVLSQTCRAVGFERRVLLEAATTLVRMPGLRQAFREGWVSWSQVRAIVTAIRPLDAAGRDQVDTLVARLAYSYVDMEADALIWEVDWLADQLRAAKVSDRRDRPVEVNRTWFTPRLDGSGSVYGEFDCDRFPLMVQSVENQANDRHRLETQPDAPDDEDDDGDRGLTDAHRAAAGVAGRNATRRGKALFELVTGRDADTLDLLSDSPSRSGRPSVLVLAHIDSLVDGTTPGWLLSPLAGRIRVTADTVRRWTANGADMRLVGIDDVGEVVGVGRRQRFARGWLRDAVIARDLHDTAPCSTAPAVHCDVDHITGWDNHGPTDLPNLTLLRRGFHTGKTHNRWKLTRHRDGTRTWTNTMSGYQIRQPKPAHLPDRPPDNNSP